MPVHGMLTPRQQDPVLVCRTTANAGERAVKSRARVPQTRMSHLYYLAASDEYEWVPLQRGLSICAWGVRRFENKDDLLFTSTNNTPSPSWQFIIARGGRYLSNSSDCCCQKRCGKNLSAIEHGKVYRARTTCLYVKFVTSIATPDAWSVAACSIESSTRSLSTQHTRLRLRLIVDVGNYAQPTLVVAASFIYILLPGSTIGHQTLIGYINRHLTIRIEPPANWSSCA